MENLHDKHRERMDKKAKLSGLYNLPEHEVLEIILFAVIPRGNTNEIAKRLLDEFGTIYKVLTADERELVKIEGVGMRAAKFLTSLYDVLGVVERSMNFPKEQIKTREEAINYAKTFFYGKLTEQFFLITLNKAGNVIGRYKLGDGSDNELHIYPKNIVVKALSDEASAVILVHNHPGGNLTASFADIQMTKKIKEVLDTVEIKLLDSVIVSGGKGISILG